MNAAIAMAEIAVVFPALANRKDLKKLPWQIERINKDDVPEELFDLRPHDDGIFSKMILDSPTHIDSIIALAVVCVTERVERTGEFKPVAVIAINGTLYVKVADGKLLMYAATTFKGETFYRKYSLQMTVAA